MKKNNRKWALIISTLLPFYSYAQVSIDKSVLNTNLYEVFISGKVLMKSGRTEEALLNYNTENQSIVFKQNEQVLTLTDLTSVDTVYIADRKFIPVENTFYEIITGTGVIGLYVTYTNKRRPVMASTDHTGTSRQSADKASNNVASAYLSRPNQLNYTAEVLTHYWLKRGNSFYKANNENQLLKVFPLKDNPSIKNYISENKINFDNREDIARLVAFCNGQMK
jgi:hypothetical protein